MPPRRRKISKADFDELAGAHRQLEHPSLAAKFTNFLGLPIEGAAQMLPKGWSERVNRASMAAVRGALHLAVQTLDPDSEGRDLRNRYKMLGATSGALGGFFGLPGLLIELPLTTTLLLRSIAHIAQSEGEDLSELETRLACIQVFAFGARSIEDNAAETGYFAIRFVIAYHLSNLPANMAQKIATEQSLPATMSVIRGIAARFGVAISDKAAAQMVPVLGAAGGALINTMFMQHYQDVARGHFVLRRLERKYGQEIIQAAYEDLTSAERAAG